MSKHTLGKFTQMNGTDVFEDIWSDGRQIADCLVSSDIPIEQQIANAILFSAAPELLEASQAAIRYDKAIKECAGDPDIMASYCTAEDESLDTLYLDWMSKANTAVSKATRSQP